MAVYIALFFIYSTTIKKSKGSTDMMSDLINKDKKKRARVETA